MPASLQPPYHPGVLALLPVCSPARPARQALPVAGTHLFTESAAMKVSKAGAAHQARLLKAGRLHVQKPKKKERERKKQKEKM